MNKIGVDLIGEISLLSKSIRKRPILKEFWGITNLKGEDGYHSFFIYFLDKDQLNIGEKCKAEFNFKFSDDDRFNIKVEVGQILELMEGLNKTGEFLIEKIVNKKLKY